MVISFCLNSTVAQYNIIAKLGTFFTSHPVYLARDDNSRDGQGKDMIPPLQHIDNAHCTQEAQLSQRACSTVRVIDNFAQLGLLYVTGANDSL